MTGKSDEAGTKAEAKPTKVRISREERLAERERKIREQSLRLQEELRQIEEERRLQKRKRFTKIAEGIADEAIKLGLDEVPVEVWRALLAENRDALLRKAAASK